MSSRKQASGRPWRRLASASAAVILLLVQACAGNGDPKVALDADPETTPKDKCGRVDAAANLALAIFPVVGQAANACKDGDYLACNPAVYPLIIGTGIVFAPMGFVIGLMSEDVERGYCARRIVES